MNITSEINTYFKNVKGLDINFDNAEITYLKQGKTNKSYLLDFTNFRLVLRINADNSSDLRINRVNEEIILNALNDISVSPNIIYCDESYKYLIYEYVEGSSLDIKRITENRKKNNNSTDLRHQVLQKEKPRGFLKKLSLSSKIGFGLIAEIKKASPSAGVLVNNFDHLEIAKMYVDNGATCLSFLTEENHFLGKLYHIL